MRSVRTPFIAAMLVGLLASSAAGVALADDHVPEGAEEILAGVNPKWVADHPDPNSLDFEEGVNMFTLYEHPDRYWMSILPDEAWCEWVSSYMNDDDGHATAQGVQGCLDGIVVGDGDRWTVVPASFAEDILMEPPIPPQSPADGPVARTGEGSGTSEVFLLDGEVRYSVAVGAPVGCDDFEAWLQMEGAPASMREPLASHGVFYWENPQVWVWGVSTTCDGRWAIVIEAPPEAVPVE